MKFALLLVVCVASYDCIYAQLYTPQPTDDSVFIPFMPNSNPWSGSGSGSGAGDPSLCTPDVDQRYMGDSSVCGVQPRNEDWPACRRHAPFKGPGQDCAWEWYLRGTSGWLNAKLRGKKSLQRWRRGTEKKNGKCKMPKVDIETAQYICENEGARLCTMQEFMQGEPYGSGCGLMNLQYWTSTECSTEDIEYGFYVSTRRDSKGPGPNRCREASWKEKALVTCCLNLEPTPMPTAFPTYFPTYTPTAWPTYFPSMNPTGFPTYVPTEFPTTFPTFFPTQFPTVANRFLCADTARGQSEWADGMTPEEVWDGYQYGDFVCAKGIECPEQDMQTDVACYLGPNEEVEGSGSGSGSGFGSGNVQVELYLP